MLQASTRELSLESSQANTRQEAERVLDRIKAMIAESSINENDFYRTFRTAPLPPATLKRVFQQYYYYIRTFPQILAGTSHLVESEIVRMKLARTVVSELGDGVGDPHFVMFEKVLDAVGVQLDDWRQADYIPEVSRLVDGLRRLFLRESQEHAIGAHFVIEEFGFPMIVNLYEGFRLYPDWKHEDYAYFYLHMLVEAEHVAWITAALIDASGSPESRRRLQDGAAQVLTLLTDFWKGLDRIAREA